MIQQSVNFSTLAVIPDDKEPKTLDPQDELLHWHYQLGHQFFKRLKGMAANGVLSCKLTHCHTPYCTACQFGKLTRQPWRTKGNQPKLATATSPGQVIAVEQMESSTLGL